MGDTKSIFEKTTFMVVEDNVPMSRLIQSVLKSFGASHIIRAFDGQKAFELYRREQPDFIITDIEMTPIDGLTLIKNIRSDICNPKHELPIIVLTSHCHKSSVIKTRDTGANEFIVKPFCSKLLRERILHALENPREFIETKTFKGPDRRRHLTEDYEGRLKRDEDNDFLYIDTDDQIEFR